MPNPANFVARPGGCVNEKFVLGRIEIRAAVDHPFRHGGGPLAGFSAKDK